MVTVQKNNSNSAEILVYRIPNTELIVSSKNVNGAKKLSRMFAMCPMNRTLLSPCLQLKDHVIGENTDDSSLAAEGLAAKKS
jgi:hypothetical protein